MMGGMEATWLVNDLLFGREFFFFFLCFSFTDGLLHEHIANRRI